VGRAYSSKLNSRKSTGRRESGHMNCGCCLNDEILSLYLWKTVSITSYHPDFERMRKKQDRRDIPNPRERAIQCETFRTFAGLTLDDLFRIGSEFGPITHDSPGAFVEMRRTQIRNLTQELISLGFASPLHSSCPTRDARILQPTGPGIRKRIGRWFRGDGG